MGAIKPTKRFVIEPLLNCNLDCIMCYHKHKKPKWRDYTKTIDAIKKEIDAGVERGNNYMDITGGEPSMYDHIAETITYAKSKGVKTCIITNGCIPIEKTNELLEAGVHGFLVSRHGLETSHNFVTNNQTAYRRQIEFLNAIAGRVHIRFNCVITRMNQSELLHIAHEISIYKPAIVNFINFNPHHEWKSHGILAKEFIPDLCKAQKSLDEAIEYLKLGGAGVNVRYYPMCRISQQNYECICNDTHVTCDPYEWDYSITPKTIEQHNRWNMNCSNANELKTSPCADCGLHAQCGGINANFYTIAGQDCVQKTDENHGTDVYRYRKHAKIQLTECE